MTFVAHLDNSPGVLARVETLFRRQDLPLQTLTLRESGATGYQVTVEADVEGEAADLVLKRFRRLADLRDVTVTHR